MEAKDKKNKGKTVLFDEGTKPWQQSQLHPSDIFSTVLGGANSKACAKVSEDLSSIRKLVHKTQTLRSMTSKEFTWVLETLEELSEVFKDLRDCTKVWVMYNRELKKHPILGDHYHHRCKFPNEKNELLASNKRKTYKDYLARTKKK